MNVAYSSRRQAAKAVTDFRLPGGRLFKSSG